jgi:hypothetical protein
MVESGYLQDLLDLAEFVQQPDLPFALQHFIYLLDHPDSATIPSSPLDLLPFQGRIHVHHSAAATFFAPSDLCGAGGMHQERIHSTPSWYGHPCRDTVFVVLDDSLVGMEGMVVARVHLFFSFNYKQVDYSCAFVNWLVRDNDKCEDDTRLWTVSLEEHRGGKPVSDVIDVRTIARAVHLIPVYGSDPIPSDIQHYNSLDHYKSFFVNAFVDHHTYEFLTDA